MMTIDRPNKTLVTFAMDSIVRTLIRRNFIENHENRWDAVANEEM